TPQQQQERQAIQARLRAEQDRIRASGVSPQQQQEQLQAARRQARGELGELLTPEQREGVRAGMGGAGGRGQGGEGGGARGGRGGGGARLVDAAGTRQEGPEAGAAAGARGGAARLHGSAREGDGGGSPVGRGPGGDARGRPPVPRADQQDPDAGAAEAARRRA